ncbi:hypothetical protein GE09DRAFT_1225184 [Coniochaeta sp. 2T2.1]|nr:hypothetical protein GE09DRAFT_1225184 [Coniochaeta sp. 2T2.1]
MTEELALAIAIESLPPPTTSGRTLTAVTGAKPVPNRASMGGGGGGGGGHRVLSSRGDVFGKALANPDSLTIQEMHQVMYWPPPDEMRALIQGATGGALGTPGELIAKAREAIERGRLQEDLNDEEDRARAYLVSGHDSSPYVMQLYPWVKS